MSDRFTRESDLARRARQQMRAAVSNLRAGFGNDLLSSPHDEEPPDPGEPEHEQRRATEPRFAKRPKDD
jgi:hypothetical protein